QYEISSGDLFLISPDFSTLEVSLPGKTHPVFFENRDYVFGFLFKAPANNGRIQSRRRDVEGKFSFRSEIAYLSGTLNFGNDLGRTTLTLQYTVGEERRAFELNFEVFPTKLDFRSDFDRIVRDIHEDYPNLVLSFLRKTYSSYDTSTGKTTDLIWWNILGGLYADLISASKLILNRPHNRMVRNSRYVVAEKIQKWSPQLEEQFSRFQHLPDRRYHSAFNTLTTNTPENRFFKHVAQTTARRFRRVRTVIEREFGEEVSEGFRLELNGVESGLDKVANHPFFRRISAFTGFKQESLVLQRASGYRRIYADWIVLNNALRFFEGLQNIELKSIAELYQIWCFLEIKKMLQQILKKEAPDDLELSPIDNKRLVSRLREGAQSRVAFETEDELVELFHELPYATKSKGRVRSYTVNQKPDPVLRITRDDLIDDYSLTYIFDAKYRLQSDENADSPDSPPDDAINQMHRYRDSIYFAGDGESKPQNEVIGAYVLFPGGGDVDEVRSADYFASIKRVNIGAFPLRPNDTTARGLLYEHLVRTVGSETHDVLNTISPQKEMVYENINPYVLIGFVRPAAYEPCFLQSNPFYYTGAGKPEHVGRLDLQYFAPYKKDHGIDEYFEILDYNFVRRDSLFFENPDLRSSDDSERMIIRLGRRFPLASVSLPDTGKVRSYRYTDLKSLRNPIEGLIKTIPSSEVGELHPDRSAVGNRSSALRRR
ncbi:MAG: DUF2357 domain-containing protein, partial [Pyrinomonadaceae bacterium]